MAEQAQANAAFEALMAFWEAAGVDGGEVSLAPGAPRAPARPQARKTTSRPRKAADPAALAREAQSLAELADVIARFDAGPLKATAVRAVFGDGVVGAPVLAIREAPGREEEEAGRAFAGPSGRLLDRMLAAIGLSRETNLYLTHCVFWRPPGGRKPDAQERSLCLPFVERAIALAQPKALLLLGEVAGQVVLRQSDGVMRLRGKRHVHHVPGLTNPLSAMVTLSPTYLLGRPQEKALAWADLLAFEALLAEEGVALSPPV